MGEAVGEIAKLDRARRAFEIDAGVGGQAVGDKSDHMGEGGRLLPRQVDLLKIDDEFVARRAGVVENAPDRGFDAFEPAGKSHKFRADPRERDMRRGWRGGRFDKSVSHRIVPTRSE